MADTIRPGKERLFPDEEYWRDSQPFLFSRGYQLRPRFRPGWVPSWVGTQLNVYNCEDSFMSIHTETIDATRIVDGKVVYIKRIRKGSVEMDIVRDLSRPHLRQNSHNHAVPILDFLAGEHDYDFIVMPLLRHFNNPPFVFVEEVTDFIRQTLEGLVFLHQNGVAHRDCSILNVMFDPESMYPIGFHPARSLRNLENWDLAPHYDRVDVLSSLTYYFTDFGISTRFDDPSQPRLVTGVHCQDREVPELSAFVPYDPFKTDVFILGNLYKKTFTEIFSNMYFLTPLVTAMTRTIPRDRPSSVDALVLYNRLLGEQSVFSLKWMLLETGIAASVQRRRSLLSLKHILLSFFKFLFKSPWRLFVPIKLLVYVPLAIYIRIRNMILKARSR